IIELTAEMSGRDVVIGGVVQEARLRATRDGRTFLAAEIEDHTGSVEVTVWPETYEGTKELWDIGNIVVVSARVKQRDDERLSISVNRVVLYGDEAFEPSALVVEPPAGGNGGGFRRNPGRGNGNGNGNGGKTAGPKTPGGPLLRIVLEETDDPEGDHERLRALVNTLREYGGEAGVRLSIKQRDGEEVEMELPSARQCPELTAQLSQIVGPWGFVGA
ncbi:MAG TPA: OB-fold nucleic acid binding domain-containing protein, partial [Dehalococcoidia bacterium]|nr:OB-fold nucleic acid binding domain-containing protein [Dehalococcoidia bacterium]